jgi:hypothetical protein
MSAKAYHKRGSSIYKTAGERWQQMVEGYSGLALTRESDKMVALHGLVKQMRPLRRGPYVAGLWRTNSTGTLRGIVKGLAATVGMASPFLVLGVN